MKNKKKEELISKGAKIHKSVKIDNDVKVIFPQNLTINKNVRIDTNVLLICKKKMKIGKNVHIGPNSILRSHAPLTVGKNTLISSFVDIFTSESEVRNIKNYSHSMLVHNSNNDQKIVIRSYCFIGSHCILLPGANLSTGTYLGAQTLINFKTKAWYSYTGNPPKITGKINSSKIKGLFKKS